MGKLFFGLIIGLVIGAGAALFLGGGAMMGTGIATGLSAGMCSTIKAAVDAEIMTLEQADQVLRGAAQEIGGLTESEWGSIVGSVSACDQFMQRIKEAAE